jgi:dihydroorotate dehydrogenase (NAD+) catalytic subunit
LSELLTTNLCGITLRNPVILAAGTNGTLDEFSDVLDLSRVGAVVSKSITREPREGNATWRIIEHRSGMLNAIGLANPGIEKFEQVYLPRAGGMECGVIASVAGFGVEDYVVVAAVIDEWGTFNIGDGVGTSERVRASGTPSPSVAAIELNVSCPNVKAGCDFGTSAEALREVVREVRKACTRTRLIVKLSPLVTDITVLAKAAVESGADALTIGNTLPAMAIDVHTRRPRLANRTGGLSGPGVHAVAVRLVHEAWTKVCKSAHGSTRPVPIIGAGGVMTWEDAAEFVLAGASAVQMGTALFADPKSPVKAVRGLERWVREQRCSNISELVGAIRLA